MELIKSNSQEREVSDVEMKSGDIPLGVKKARVDDIIVDEQSVRKNFIDKLDYICLSEVLLCLPVAQRMEMEKVCQKWKEVTKLSWSNVKKLTIDDNSIFLQTEKISEKILENCCRYLTHLIITAIRPWMYEIIKENLRNVIHYHIKLDHHYPDDEIADDEKNSYKNLFQAIESMSKLKFLKVKLYDWIGDSRMQIFNWLPSHMEELYVSADGNISTVVDLPDKLINLRCLKLSKFRLTDATIKTILSNRNTLVHLDLSWCEFPTGASSMFSDLINLEHLKLKDVENLGVDTITKIARNCQKLKHFEFESYSHCKIHSLEIPHHILNEFKYLVNLNHLSISDVMPDNNDVGILLSSIAKCELKHLDIGTKKKYLISTDNSKLLLNFKKIEFLHLSRAQIDSQSLIDITNNCLELKNFNMNFDNVSESALESLANLKNLERLNFFELNNLTGDVMTKILSGCRNVAKLGIFRCNNLTEASLLQVVKLKHLEFLAMNAIKNVPNAIFNDLPNLKDLYCTNCPSVTDEDIIKVIDNCQNLEKLDLWGTGITAKTLLHKPASPRLVPKKLRIWANVSFKQYDKTSPHKLSFSNFWGMVYDDYVRNKYY